jgi:anti-anti-sigma factor
LFRIFAGENGEMKPRMKVGNLEEVLTLSGLKELTAANADMFRKEVHAAVNGHKVVEVDLSQTTIMDCGGLGALIALRNLVRDRDGMVRLLHPTPPVHRLFEATGAGNIFEIVTKRPGANQSTHREAAQVTQASRPR